MTMIGSFKDSLSKVSESVYWLAGYETGESSSGDIGSRSTARLPFERGLPDVEMDDYGDSGSIGSSDDTRSHDLSINTEFEENYFSCPIDDALLQSSGEIEEAIEQVKALVLETDSMSKERVKFVKRLVALRIRLQDVKDIQDEGGNGSVEEFRLVNSHQFIIQTKIVHRAPQYCDKCGGIIWTVMQYFYKCKNCFYQCHSKCLNHVLRKCPALKVSVDADYLVAICPEVGLPSQNYQCFECNTRFTLKNSWMEPRKCDYNGRYYCPLCHKNYAMSIPARILHNWDFEERPVAEDSRQFLMLMSKKPNINIQKINPRLFNFVEDLNAIKRLREDILMIKEFFMTCRDAFNKKLLRKLEEKQHFVETSFMYSLQDLIDTNKGTMLPFLEKLHGEFIKHIKEQCLVCKGKGFICEICENIQVIYPFDSATHQCASCHTLFHSICFVKRESCPKCLRISKRASLKSEVGLEP